MSRVTRTYEAMIAQPGLPWAPPVAFLIPLAVALITIGLVLAAEIRANGLPPQIAALFSPVATPTPEPASAPEVAAGPEVASGQFIPFYSPAGFADGPMRLFYTENVTRTAPAPSTTQMEGALLEAIAGATTSIDAALYDLDRPSVLQALLDAKARGVAVRIVTDDAEREPSSGSRPAYDALVAAGIPVIDDSMLNRDGTGPTRSVGVPISASAPVTSSTDAGSTDAAGGDAAGDEAEPSQALRSALLSIPVESAQETLEISVDLSDKVPPEIAFEVAVQLVSESAPDLEPEVAARVASEIAAQIAADYTLDVAADGARAGRRGMRSGIMHDKYFLIDGTRLWTGSVNMSMRDIGLNHNNALFFFEDPALVAAYQFDFDQMINGIFGTGKTPSPQTSFTVTLPISTSTSPTIAVPMTLVFAPQDQPLIPILDAINQAKESIDFAIFYFTSDPVRDALLAAHERGVRIRGIWDALGSANASAPDEELCEAGIPILIEQTKGLMHNKLIVVDAFAQTPGARPSVVTGSLNWTSGGVSINNENTLVLYHPLVAAAYAFEFQNLWENVGGEPCNPELQPPAVVNAMLPIVLNQQGAPDATPIATSTPDASAPEATPTAAPEPTPEPTPTPRPIIIVIERVVYNPPGGNVEGERVDLRNRSGVSVNLAGWQLTDAQGATYTFRDSRVKRGATFSVWVREGSDDEGNFFWGRAAPVWNNDGDTATLLRPDGTVAAECTYTGGGEEFDCTER